MRYKDLIKQAVKEDDGGGATASADVATLVTPLGATTKKNKKVKPIFIKRPPL